MRQDNTLDPGSAGPYQVHGRLAISQGGMGNHWFLPNEQTCALGVLAPSASTATNGGWMTKVPGQVPAVDPGAPRRP